MSDEKRKELLNKIAEFNENRNHKTSFYNKEKNTEKQITKNNQKTLMDDKDEFNRHKEKVYEFIDHEFDFKKKARKISVWAFLILSILMLINLLVILYWNPVSLSDSIILALITATCANIFTIIVLIFKFIFSPTKDMMDYNTQLNNNGQE